MAKEIVIPTPLSHELLNFPPTSVVNHSAAGGITDIKTLYFAISNVKKVLSGALTAATYKEILAVSGRGILDFVAVGTTDATARTVGLKITIDGTDIFDAVSGSLSANWLGLVGVGYVLDPNNGYPGIQPCPFSSSLSIQIKSSLTETDKIAAYYIYRTT